MIWKIGTTGLAWMLCMLMAKPSTAQDAAPAPAADETAAQPQQPQPETAPSSEPVPADGTIAPPVEPIPVEPMPADPGVQIAPPAAGSGVAGADATLDTATYAPAPPPPGYETMNLPPRPKKGLMIAGWGVFGGSYLFTVLVGLTMLSGDVTDPGETCTNCNTVGPRLMIPLVGPFLSIPDADGADGRAVCAILGMAQVAGLTLGVVGTILYAKKKKAYREAVLNAAIPRLHVGFDGKQGGAMLSWQF